MAVYVVECCTTNESEPSPASPFRLDPTLKIVPPRPYNSNREKAWMMHDDLVPSWSVSRGQTLFEKMALGQIVAVTDCFALMIVDLYAAYSCKTESL